jgi:hypothetical protein
MGYPSGNNEEDTENTGQDNEIELKWTNVVRRSQNRNPTIIGTRIEESSTLKAADRTA